MSSRRPARSGLGSALAALALASSASAEELTYASDVAPVVRRCCQGCHRPGGGAPFALLGFDDVRRHARTIERVVEVGYMPPWHADPRFGEFANDRRLVPEEKAILLRWIRSGMAPGQPVPDSAPVPAPGGWQIGEPDLVFELPEEVVVPAEGEVPYHNYRVPTGLEEDVWIQAAETKPGNDRVVHHIIVAYFDDDPLAWARGDGRVVGSLGGFVPGAGPLVMPPGVGRRLPAGSTLAFQMHYTPTGRIERDRSKVGLVLAKEKPLYESKTGLVSTPFLWIPAGAKEVRVEATHTFDEEVFLLSMRPHMHLRGSSFEYRAIAPDGREEVLLRVPEYDFAWQTTYVLKEERRMTAGTVLRCVATYDNSAGNPANPDPTRDVSWGERTSDEMMIGFFQYRTARRLGE